MDTAGQGWTGVWSQFGHGLFIVVGEGVAVVFVIHLSSLLHLPLIINKF